VVDGPETGLARHWGSVWPVLVTGILFFAGSRVGLLLTVPGTTVGLVWPPAGLSLGLMILFGYRVWPGIFLGALAGLLPNLWLDYPPGTAILVGLVQSAADLLPVALGSWWFLREPGGRNPFASVRKVLVFALLSAALAQATGPTLGLGLMILGGHLAWAQVPSAWLCWWLSDVISVLLITPCILIWCTPALRPPMGQLWRHGTTFVVSVGITFLAFRLGAPGSRGSLDYLLLFFAIAAPFRLGPAGVSGVSLAVAVTAVLCTASGCGPFATGSPRTSLLLLSVFLAVLAMAGGVLAGLLAEADEAEQERRRLEREFHHAMRLDSLGTLAAGVAHDMNNILGAVMASADLMDIRAGSDPKIRRWAEAIQESCVRGRDLVQRLNQFCRKELETEVPLDLNAIVGAEVEILRHTTLGKVEFDMDLAGDLPQVKGEASSIANLVMNLCVNAVDAMPQGGTLTFRSRRDSEGGVLLTVGDTGEGMPPEVLARAMEPFFTTKAPGKGTGLGLSMAHGTMKAHGGAIAIRSEVGAGTTVTLRFPGIPGL
jgi:signal transduction histidine kinase